VPTKRGNSEGSLTKRTDGLWEARITLEGGKRKSFYAKTRQEAARKLVEALRDRDRGLPVVGDRQTLTSYLSSWLDTAKATIRQRTWKRYEQYIRIHVIPILGNVGLSKLTPIGWGQGLQRRLSIICMRCCTRPLMLRYGLTLSRATSVTWLIHHGCAITK